jgi:hypothetical protein
MEFYISLSRVYDDTFTCWPELSLLFAVFALGALFDPARPPFSIESQEYYLLSRVTLINFAEPIFKSTISIVMTLVRAVRVREISSANIMLRFTSRNTLN